MSDKYDTCKKCGAEAVGLMNSSDIVLFGRVDEAIESNVRVGCYACLECENIEEAWLLEPHHGDDERILNWLQAQWNQRLGTGPAHELACRVHLGEDLREVAKELMGRGQ